MAMESDASALPMAASFVATSNLAALRARLVSGEGRALEEIISASEIFSIAAAGRIVQSSAAGQAEGHFAAKAGLVTGIVDAYNSHHELILRADDVWQAVLIQFSFYVQRRTEELRDALVDFQGQKQLVVCAGGTLFTADFGSMARRMVDEQIAKNIKDASLAQWLIPNFSTTTSTDRVVASVTMMATLQAYFKYKFRLECGLPRVTLLGTAEDWRALRIKIDRLPEFDLRDKLMSKWHAMLVPVFDHLLKSAESHPELSFWDKVCSHIGGGSGPSYLSGWVTVFAVFSEKGEWQGELDPTGRCGSAGATEVRQWPRIDTEDIPAGVVSVPVLVDDNGTEYDTKMLAGQFAYSVTNAGKAIQPRADWCIALLAEPALSPDAAEMPSDVAAAVLSGALSAHPSPFRCRCVPKAGVLGIFTQSLQAVTTGLPERARAMFGHSAQP